MFQGFESIGAELETEGLEGHLGCDYWSEDGLEWRTDGMVLGSIGIELGGNAASVECDTFHLSAFTSRQESTTPRWSTADLLTDFSVFGEVERGIHLLVACRLRSLKLTIAHDKSPAGRRSASVVSLRTQRC